MEIYFSGSIAGGREKQQDYFELINYLKKFGTVLTEHVGNLNTEIEEKVKLSSKEDEHVYLRDTKWIDECDIVIADVSIPSLGVGYELGYAESQNKKIICLYDIYSEKRLSFMVSGNSKNIIIQYKDLDDIKKELERYLI